METPQNPAQTAQNPAQPQPASDLNPEVAAWLKEYPTPEATLALEVEKQKEFVSKYYAADDELDEQIEKMLDQAETTVDKEIAAGKNKFPFSEELVVGIINISKVKVLDEMIEEVSKLYQERRGLVKGKEITDPVVAMITQRSCTKMAMLLQQKLVKQIEEEVKSRELPLNQFMQIVIGYLMGDLSMFVEVEKFYNLKKVEENKDKPCDIEKLRKYIEESIKISDLILQDKISQNSLFLFPHILSDKLFNETGYESEEIVYHIRQMNENNTMDEETLKLIITEAYSVEKSKEKCFATFDKQMKDLEAQFQMMELAAKQEAERRKQAGGQLPPGQKPPMMEDKALLKMMQMGLNVPPGMAGPGMAAPGGPGGPPPGMFPPGMFPPGMMPPGMMPPGMVPPGMVPPQPKQEGEEKKPEEKSGGGN